MIIYPDLSQILELYDEVTRISGGAYGLRDLGSLESAIYQPQQSFDGNDLYKTLHEKAAALGFALIMNHPFVDGNKRMGLVSIDFFLSLNGHFLNTTEDDAVETMLSVASGVTKKNELAEWIRIHISDL